jgi:dynein assembly factor 5
MATFERDIATLADADRMKRKAALKRLEAAVKAPEAGAWEPEKLRTLTAECLRRFEDVTEGCRETAIDVVRYATPLQRPEIMDFVLPSVAARIGTEPIREESEELRLKLLDLAVLCLNTFPHDLGAYIDFYPVIIANCMADPFPDLKRRACVAAMRLCEVEPKRVKSCTVQLAKAVKQHCLGHKHAVVRGEAIKCFGVLVKHGAAELLGDMKDEQDNRTTVWALYQLANDKAEAVRAATLEVMSMMLLDIDSKQEQPRRLLPFVLSMLSDPIAELQEEARRLLKRLGDLYTIDNADNRVDLNKRRVTLKDIAWYADDAFPDMTLATKSTCNLPDLNRRPTLGARHAVAEHMRSFLDQLLTDATSVNWTIPHSAWNRRTVALRTLEMAIAYCESNVVQYAQQILQTLYKVVRDDDREVSTEGLVCAELMGKFMTTDQYLPFLVAQSEDEEDGSVLTTKKKTITMLNADGTPAVGTNKLPTLFSTAGNVTKASILVVMKLMLLGARHTLTAEQAKLIVKALTDPSLVSSDSPDLAKNLIAVQLSTAEMLVERGFVVRDVSPDAGRTLDSMLMYSVLAATASEDASVAQAADNALATFSARLFDGDRLMIYQQHFGRWIKRHLKEMPPEALTRLITNSPDLSAHAQFLTELFYERLKNIAYNMRVTAELALFNIMRSVLDSERLPLSTDQLEILLRTVLMPQLKFTPGPTANLFRKVAFATLRAVLKPFNRRVIHSILHAEDGALGDKLVAFWLNGVDADDAEIRFQSIDAIEDVCELPMQAGTASDVVDHLMQGLNDPNDHLRYAVASKLRSVLYSGGDVSPAIVGAVHAKIVSMTQTLLVHLDDLNDTLGIRQQLVLILRRLKGINRDLVHEMASQARSKHATTQYCDQVLEWEPNA